MDTFERMVKAARAANENPGLFSAQEMWQRSADAWRLAGAPVPETDTQAFGDAEDAAEYQEVVDDWDPRPLPDDERLMRWAAWGGEWLGADDDGEGHAVWAPLDVDGEDWGGNRDKDAWRPLGPDGPVTWADFYAQTHPPIPGGWEEDGRWEHDASVIKSGGTHILGGAVGGYTLTAGDGWSVRVKRAASTAPIGDVQEEAPSEPDPLRAAVLAAIASDPVGAAELVVGRGRGPLEGWAYGLTTELGKAVIAVGVGGDWRVYTQVRNVRVGRAFGAGDAMVAASIALLRALLDGAATLPPECPGLEVLLNTSHEASNPDDLPPVPEGYEAVGEWVRGNVGRPPESTHIMFADGRIVRWYSVGPIAEEVWRPIRAVTPSDDTIPAGYLRDGPWERGGTREAGIGGALSGEVYSSGTGWRCCVRRVARLPEGFRWNTGCDCGRLHAPGDSVWAYIDTARTAVWQNGNSQREQRRPGPFSTLEAAKEWCERTLFPPADSAGPGQASPLARKFDADDPIDAMSDEAAIAEAEAQSCSLWHIAPSGAFAYLGPRFGIEGAYAAAYGQEWRCWGGSDLSDVVAERMRTGGDVRSDMAAASRAMLKHWREHPEDRPASQPKDAPTSPPDVEDPPDGYEWADSWRTGGPVTPEGAATIVWVGEWWRRIRGAGQGPTETGEVIQEVARLREAVAALTREIASLTERMEGR